MCAYHLELPNAMWLLCLFGVGLWCVNRLWQRTCASRARNSTMFTSSPTVCSLLSLGRRDRVVILEVHLVIYRFIIPLLQWDTVKPPAERPNPVCFYMMRTNGKVQKLKIHVGSRALQLRGRHFVSVARWLVVTGCSFMHFCTRRGQAWECLRAAGFAFRDSWLAARVLVHDDAVAISEFQEFAIDTGIPDNLDLGAQCTYTS